MGSSQQNHSQNGSEGQHDESGPLVMLFIFFGLLCGSILREVNKKTKIPYTPMLLILGIFFGYFAKSLGVIGQSIQIIEDMSPHMILFVFIPILIFESAFNCDWYVFRKSMVNILILAGPGVLWGAFIIAFIFKVILGYGDDDLTWYEALALGCVLSATDPVAVVALLKDLGATVKFNTLVEGESLLNDGTAMVFFMLFMSLVKGEDSSPLSVVSNFVRVSLGGPLLGICVGFLISWWMKKIIRDAVLSVNITFIGAFLCFYLAEFTWLKVSGILSIVVLGLYFSAVGKLKIYPESEHALHNVWSSIQFGSETLIFVLTGIVVGVKMLSETSITGMDWIKMFCFWFLMILARALMVMTFYPFIIRSGYGISRKQLVVLIYGGLRGALGLCLSLFVGVDESLNTRFRELTVFYMCGMAMLTIVVNGLTCNKLVNYLEMINVPEIKEKLLKRCVKKVLLDTQERLRELKNEPSISYAKWKDVQKMAQVKTLGNTFHQRNTRVSNVNNQPIRDSFKDFKKADIIEELRFRFTRYLGKVYWEFYEEGELSQESIKILSESCDIVNDQVTIKLRYFDILSSNFTMDTMEFYSKFKDTIIIGKFVVRAMIQKVYFAYEISLAFVEACEEVMHEFNQKFPMHSDAMSYVLEEVKQNIENANSYLSELENNYPKIIQAVHTQRAATILLKNKKNKLKQMHEEGFIDDTDYSKLRQQIDVCLINVRIKNYKLSQIKFSEVLTQCPLFSSLSTNEIIQLRKKAREITYDKGSKLILKGKQISFATIIISGSIKQQFDDFSFVKSLGSIINPYDFTYKEASKCTVKARNTIKVLEIDEATVLDLMNNNNQFKKRWYKTLFPYSLRLDRGLAYLQKEYTDKQLRRYIEAADVEIMKVGEQMSSPEGAFVFTGEVECDRNIYIKGNFISKGKTFKALTSGVVVLIFKVVGGIKGADERMSVLNEDS